MDSFMKKTRNIFSRIESKSKDLFRKGSTPTQHSTR